MLVPAAEDVTLARPVCIHSGICDGVRAVQPLNLGGRRRCRLHSTSAYYLICAWQELSLVSMQAGWMALRVCLLWNGWGMITHLCTQSLTARAGPTRFVGLLQCCMGLMQCKEPEGNGEKVGRCGGTGQEPQGKKMSCCWRRSATRISSL